MRSVPLFCALFFPSLQRIAQSPPLSISLPAASLTKLSWPSSAADWRLTTKTRSLPASVGTLSSNETLPVRGPTWTGTTDSYRAGGFGDLMFITGAVNDESAGGASVNWNLTPSS